jgi:hypothetical protein
MVAFLANSWFLLSLLSLPALAAIYWLRNRFRRVPVSSLLLWADQEEARQGGWRLDRLQTPLLFFLELAALALLSVAAAGPQAATGRVPRPLVVVLDDSYSMLAGGENSPRAQALAALAEELRSGEAFITRFVLAGRTHQTLGVPVRDADDALAILTEWKCHAPEARLDEAVGFAVELGGPHAVILVLSDHQPAVVPDKGRVRWWAFGKPLPNLAFVSAARSQHAKGERCLLEVANLSAEPQKTPILVTSDLTGPIRQENLALGPGESRLLVYSIPPDTPALTARLGEDALAIDNQVTLLRQNRSPVAVQVRIQDKVLRPLVEKALRATGQVSLGSAKPDLLVTDEEAAAADNPDTWILRLLAEKEAEAFVGPFILDRSHPLTEGLSLKGVIWGAGKNTELPGQPVVLAGNVPLLTDVRQTTGRHELRLRLRPDLATLQDAPAWPVLFWNLVQWRSLQAPGLDNVNLRLGDTAVLRIAGQLEEALVITPDGSERQVAVLGGGVVVRAEETGRYEVRTPGGKFTFVVNTLNRDESDLTACVSGRWGDWIIEEIPGTEARNLAWVLLLLTLGILAVHLYFATGRSKSTQRHEPGAVIPERLA